MKNYINPQSHAVERINTKKNQPEPLEKGKPKKANKTSKEIYRTEAEEQAWRDTLKKDKLNQKSKNK